MRWIWGLSYLLFQGFLWSRSLGFSPDLRTKQEESEPTLKTFISCYITPGPQKGFWRGFWRVSEGSLKAFWRGFEGSFGWQVRGPFKNPPETLSETPSETLHKPFWGSRGPVAGDESPEPTLSWTPNLCFGRQASESRPCDGLPCLGKHGCIEDLFVCSKHLS